MRIVYRIANEHLYMIDSD